MRRNILLFIIAILAVIIATGAALFAFSQYQDAQKETKMARQEMEKMEVALENAKEVQIASTKKDVEIAIREGEIYYLAEEYALALKKFEVAKILYQKNTQQTPTEQALIENRIKHCKAKLEQ